MTQSGTTIEANVARWALPLLKPRRYKVARGGRSGGKSHQLCELAAQKMAADPNYKVAGIREVQKSIKHSLKSLLEQKIHEQGASYLFDMQATEIKRNNGDTAAAFFGMQDHTADAVKGLEDFDLGLVDEANNLSATSIKKLTPTLRKEGSEIWFAYNPDQETDPIDVFIAENEGHEDFLVLSVNITDNPFVSDTAWAEYRREKARANAAQERVAAARAIKEDPADSDLAILDKFNHVWRGYYDKRSQRLIFHNWKEGELEVPDNVIWFYGVDWGFASDPMAANRFCFPTESTMFITHEAHGAGIRTEDVPGKLKEIPGIAQHVSKADNARPEMIDYCRRHGLPKMRPCKKGKGSVEDGYSFLQGLDIIIHPRCTNTINEFKTHSYKIVKHTGEILTTPEDKDNHHIDDLRYACEGLHRRGKLIEEVSPKLPKRRDYDLDDFDEDEVSWKTM